MKKSLINRIALPIIVVFAFCKATIGSIRQKNFELFFWSYYSCNLMLLSKAAGELIFKISERVMKLYDTVFYESPLWGADKIQRPEEPGFTPGIRNY